MLPSVLIPGIIWAHQLPSLLLPHSPASDHVEDVTRV